MQNVVVITLDTTRADALDLDPSDGTHTPQLAALAAEGTSFPRAYSTAPLTLPAHASMFTGLFPPRHRVRENGMNPLSQSALTLAERLRDAGMRTAAFVSADVLNRFFGLAQGFEVYDQPAPGEAPPASGYIERRANSTVRAATTWLEDVDSDEPFFLWLHLFDAHIPYLASAKHLRAAGGDEYLAEVASMDSALGELFDALERLERFDRTLVIVVGDHGESRGEHGELTHGALCYESALRVPFIVRHPGASFADAADSIVTIADIFPTVIDALGLASAESAELSDVDGASLSSLSGTPDRGVYFESMAGFVHYGWSPLAGWRSPTGKYLHSSNPEFYDVDVDIHEDVDVARERGTEIAAARASIERVLARSTLPLADDEGSSEFASQLRALGYGYAPRTSDDWPSPLAPSKLPAPRDRASELDRVAAAHALVSAARYEEAQALLADVLAENPAHRFALELSSNCLLELGRFDEACDALLARDALGSTPLDALLNLAFALEATGDLGRAAGVLERATHIAPDDADAHAGLSRLRSAAQGEKKDEN